MPAYNLIPNDAWYQPFIADFPQVVKKVIFMMLRPVDTVDEKTVCRHVATSKFSRVVGRNILNFGGVEPVTTGRLADEAVFEGKDMIQVIDKAAKK